MKCQRCPKQATLHITEVLGDERFEEVHLCEDCAKKYLYEPQQKKNAKQGVTATSEVEEDTPAGARCPSCGMTFLEFRNHGRFGCAHDYDAFKPDLLPLMESVHGDTKHAGKIPRRAPRTATTQAELAQLRHRLQTLIDEEKYEEAARTRDRIKELETS
ncbi:MAG: UvrB/UvrC motif-containing protein [Planctomycetes bacterium]|nr:UvrB/UvrC motif-containing protein [Planctomycetota bacterium]